MGRVLLKHGVIFLFIIFNALSAFSSVEYFNCESTKSFADYDHFSEEIFGSDFYSLSTFYKQWIKTKVDSNQDLIISNKEFKSISCHLSETIKDLTNKLSYEFPVFMNGSVNMLEYWAHDQKITNVKEFEIAIGKEARDWLLDYFWSSKEIPFGYKTKIMLMISKGEYVITAKDLSQQVDLTGSDSSNESIYRKAIELTSIIDQLKANKVSTDLTNTYYKQASETKTFARLTEFYPHYLKGFIHSYKATSIGDREVYNFSVFESHGVNITKEGYAIGQPKNQKSFLLKNPQFMYVPSKDFTKRVGATLDFWSQTKEFRELIGHYYNQPINNSEELRLWLQKAVDQLADVFWQDSLQVGVSMNISPEGGEFYLDGQRIYVNGQSLFVLNKKLTAAPDEFLKHLIYKVTQEWVHYLQRLKPDLYNDNISFYNDSEKTKLMFGKPGEKWYKDQPLEKDADDIAKNFVLRTRQKFIKK